mmetsp:Transcript_25341/g.38417  ORF Transcript_25341/g.38417 Transcript_25341/m.38417 type:complete len:289 (+) Transcript_25341:123-989(+)
MKTENDNMKSVPKMIRVPCHARNVDDTHTPQTAYFEYPEDITHGRVLRCSHKLCRESGRQFRFCKICNKICAKRNFSSRHAHTENMQVSNDGKETAAKTPIDDPEQVMMCVSRKEAELLKAIRGQTQDKDRLLMGLMDTLKDKAGRLGGRVWHLVDHSNPTPQTYCQPLNHEESTPEQIFKKQIASIRSIDSSKGGSLRSLVMCPISDKEEKQVPGADLDIDLSITNSGRTVAHFPQVNSALPHPIDNKDNKKDEYRMASLDITEIFHIGQSTDSVASMMEVSNLSLS